MIQSELDINTFSSLFHPELQMNGELLDKIDEDSLGTTDTNSSYLTSTSNSTLDSNNSDCLKEASDIEASVSQAPGNSKRKFFTKKEDHLLTIAALHYREGSWNDIARYVPGRTPKQCRDRWVNYLQPSLKFEPWTNADDKLLVLLVNQYGTHWTKMKNHFPNRSTNALKNRWYWMIKNHVTITPLKRKKNLSEMYQKQGRIHAFQHEHGKNNIGSSIMENNYPNNNGDNLSHQGNPSLNYLQNNYFFVLKNNNNSSKGKKKRNSINISNGKINNNNKNIGNNNYNKNIKMEPKNNKNNDDELITFDSDELDW